MIQPHRIFDYIRADEVAETWDKVPHELYVKLWNEVVPHQRPLPNIEDNDPDDLVGWEALASHWHRLNEHEQAVLNGLAKAIDDRIEAHEQALRAR